MNQETLKTLVRYDRDSGKFFSLNERTSRRTDSEMKGNVNERGYLRIVLNGKKYKAHRLAWIYEYGAIPEGMQIDHKDRNKLNNRIDNLRLATSTQNKQNIHKPRSDNKSGFLGVWFCKRTEKFNAEIVVDKKKVTLGSFDTPELASEAYLAAKRKYHEFYHEDKKD